MGFYVLKRPRNGNTATSDFKTAKTPSSILRVAVFSPLIRSMSRCGESSALVTMPTP
jgi:hypothetical protein